MSKGFYAEWSADLEQRYRQHYLRADARQASIVLVILILPIVGLAHNDFHFFGFTLKFFGLIAVRVALAASCLALLVILRRISHYRAFDRLILCWALFALTLNQVINISRPPTYVLHVVMDMMYVFIIYLIITFKFTYQIISAVYFALTETIVLLLFKDPSLRPYFFTVFFSIILSGILGLTVSWQLNRLRRHDFRAREELNRLAERDSLTSIYNSRRFMELGEAEMTRFQRYGHPFAFMIIDLDHFKLVNDRYGHLMGDMVLIKVVEAITGQLRKVDISGRLGGEEFGILLPEMNVRGAEGAANRILDVLRSLNIDAENGERIKVAGSIGIAEAVKTDTCMDHMISRADTALYRAKEKGRDRFEIA